MNTFDSQKCMVSVTHFHSPQYCFSDKFKGARKEEEEKVMLHKYEFAYCSITVP
jgi:hypothetical protein